MAEADEETLRDFELRLFRCSLSPASPSSSLSSSVCFSQPGPFQALLEHLVELIEKGSYSEALNSDASRFIFGSLGAHRSDETRAGAENLFGEVERAVVNFLVGNESEAWLDALGSDDDPDKDIKGLLVMCIGIAALLVFTQCNLTGPPGDFPACPLQLLCNTSRDVTEWNKWARSQLICDGSDLHGKYLYLQYLVFAKLLVSKVKDMHLAGKTPKCTRMKTISWWLSRVIFFQQRILEDRSISLYNTLQELIQETLFHFGSLEEVIAYWGTKLCEGEAPKIVSAAHLEAGIIEHAYSHTDISGQHFKNAEVACGLQFSVTGVLGFRTVHQAEAKAQMVLIATPNAKSTGNGGPLEYSQVQRDGSVIDKDERTTYSDGLHEECDILMAPRLVRAGKDIGVVDSIIQSGRTAIRALDTIQQAVILAHCLFIRKNTPDDEMQKWEMAPFIEAVDAQQLSHYMVRCFCEILRVRWESTRNRTKQRALLMMDELVNDIKEVSPSAGHRIHYAFVVYAPTIPALQKEYGELLVACGMIGDALKIFEELELWDNLILCYRLLEKNAAAIDLIKTRLCHTPEDPRLWCSLGDVTNNDVNYIKALEVSKNKSARAQRSLARSAYNRADYENAIRHWEAALALNSLYPDGWFALGSAALKAREFDKAIDASTRAVQLDPENGEAWNNLACLHMVKNRSKESFIAFKEALKFRRTSWQMWENYGRVAMDVCNCSQKDFLQAIEATKTVLDLTGNKRVNVDLLERLMLEMEARTSQPTLDAHSTKAHASTIETDQEPSGECANDSRHVDSSNSSTRITDHLLDMLGKVLQQVIRSNGGGEIWGLYARWHRIRGDVTMCSEALLKQVRSYQGSDLWHNEEKFKKFARASVQLCKIYMEIASSSGSCKELTTAEMHLRNAVKQAEIFSGTEEYRELEACLTEVKKQSDVVSAEKVYSGCRS
ncbi:tetratricopeptide repeat protein 27 homolog isoform X1 [Amborella trichopoda]|uniref:tetratricopeptide repeat protein 27 homolog isoform X1 n=1 Tax=Amborella trichopoda TaxID=13333 RepID=UPI0009C0FD92|nr:tetratricopeptide repeat protein 27 homolog isoform X1 [Amborella trichopoda]|eukprot:XP_020527481.1 tetratricopeptide repeat protein 27 homolog isoform X1 [Amborella trichopoda]